MARTRKKSKTQQWLARHVQDSYVQQAQKQGYRSRAVYKLMEIDERDALLAPAMTVVDLGAAPGSWSQYAAERIGPNGRLFALDILPMEPLPGVEVIEGDFTQQEVLDRLLDGLQGRQIDLVISDMAPNISGISVSDQARGVYLGELALEFAAIALKPGGDLLFKAFQGEGYPALQTQMKARFQRLLSRKPKASRARSREIYLLGKGLLP